MPVIKDGFRLLSIGRYCIAKNFDNVPAICSCLLKKGFKVKWYIIGFGGDEELIRQKIAESKMEEYVILLGKKENYEEGNISALDIVIVRIDFGSFSQDNASEIFVLCKILNTPHVAGLDKTVGILLDADSLEMVAYKEFAADKVVINCIQASDGQSRILVSKTTTYQGISTQEIQLLAVEGSQWVEIPIDALKIIGDESFYYMDIVDDLIIVASEDKLISSEEIVAVLKWNPETEQFVLEQ